MMEMSGFSLPNNFVAVLLQALDELMGTNGLRSLLNAADLKDWIQAPPAMNNRQEVDFSQFARLSRTLEDLYGEKGSQSLMRRANKIAFNQVWVLHPQLNATKEPEFQSLDRSIRVERGLTAFAQTLSESSDILAKVKTEDPDYSFILERCPYCWDISSEKPQCHAFFGLLESALGLFAPDSSIEIIESTCIGTGEAACEFKLRLLT
jgi:predicted hydrocarbon binding protein